MIYGDVVRQTSRSLLERLPELTGLVRRRLREHVPAYAADRDPALAMHESERIATDLRSFIEGAVDASEPLEPVLREVMAEARSAAQAGIDLTALIQTYRVAQAAIWDVVLAETTRLIPDPEQQLAAQKHMSHYHFRWNDNIVSAVVRAYQDEQRSFFFQSRDRRLRAALRDLISGGTDGLPQVDYPLDAAHIAAVLWGERPEATVEKITTAVDAKAVVSVGGTSGTTLAWFAVDQGEGTLERLRTHWQPPPGAFAAFGNVAAGVQGFRSSHHQAWRAYRVGRLSNAVVSWYRDVALESVFLQDLQAARDLVAQQLGPLDLNDPRTEVLCQTMRAYFAVGCNAAQAAAQLQVHERTVAYRLRTIEERLDIDVIKRRDELVVALRLLDRLRTISAATSPIDPLIRLST